MTVDLDQARAARREASGVAPVVVFHGTSYELPVEMPFALAGALADVGAATQKSDAAAVSAGVERGLAALFGDRTPEFMQAAPTMGDVMALFQAIVAEYGFASVGEASASESS